MIVPEGRILSLRVALLRDTGSGAPGASGGTSPPDQPGNSPALAPDPPSGRCLSQGPSPSSSPPRRPSSCSVTNDREAGLGGLLWAPACSNRSHGQQPDGVIPPLNNRASPWMSCQFDAFQSRPPKPGSVPNPRIPSHRTTSRHAFHRRVEIQRLWRPRQSWTPWPQLGTTGLQHPKAEGSDLHQPPGRCPTSRGAPAGHDPIRQNAPLAGHRACPGPADRRRAGGFL